MFSKTVIFRDNDIKLVCQPFAGIDKPNAKFLHYEVDDTSSFIADIAFPCVFICIEVQAWMCVIVHEAQGKFLLGIDIQF